MFIEFVNFSGKEKEEMQVKQHISCIIRIYIIICCSSYDIHISKTEDQIKRNSEMMSHLLVASYLNWLIHTYPFNGF